MAERARFELAIPLRYDGFQDRCLKPLGHLSTQVYRCKRLLAEREGFEPSRAFAPNDLANRPLQPLGYLSVINYGGRILDGIEKIKDNGQYEPTKLEDKIRELSSVS